MNFGLKGIFKSAIAATFLALLLVFSGGCRKPAAKIKQKPPTSVIITHPTNRNIRRTVRFSGQLKGSREVMVFPPMPGKFIGYSRSDGSYVSKGATVAKIDRDIPGVSYEPVPVEAPISGRFFSMGISPGEAVLPQKPIGRISETSRLKLAFNIPEKYVNNAKQGSAAEVYVPAIDLHTTGRLSRISRFVDARSGGAQAEAMVSNPAGRIAPGMHAEIKVVVASKKAKLALPIDCILGLEKKFVYVVEKKQKKDDAQADRGEQKIALKRNVEVGLDDGKFIEIISGLEPSDEVLYVGQRIVDEGGAIKVNDVYTPAED